MDRDDEPDKLADQLQRESDELEHHSDKLREDIADVREDAERRAGDPGVSGRSAPPPEADEPDEG